MRYIDGLKTAVKRTGAILAQLGQPEYPFSLDGLNTVLQAVFEGRFKDIGGNGFPSEKVAAEHDFTVEADVVASLYQAKGVEYVSFLEKGEPHVPGKTMRGRAVILEANYGLLDAIYLRDDLRDNPHLIPEDMRGNKGVVFAGTLLRHSDGNLYVACLSWDSDRWVLNFLWVGYGFGAYVVLPRSK